MDDYALTISAREVIALIVALGSMITMCLTVHGRNKQGKGIGWQFIRFNSIMLALPLSAILALTGTLNASSATILAGALGYAFGRSGDEEKPPS